MVPTGRFLPRLAGAATLALLAGCAVGPDYSRPEAPTPVAYKELKGWKPSEPKEAASNAPWWSIYGDPTLDELERQIDISNQNLKAAEAAFRQARALVTEARAQFFPTVDVNGSGTRSGQGRHTGSSSSVARSTGFVQNQYDLSASASWEIDVWGRIRRTVESQTASAQASAADLASARLSAQAELASDYFQLRVADQLKRLLDDTVEADTRSLQISQNKYASGTAAKSDVAQAQAQVENVRAQSINVGVQRAQLEHAIAVLIGKPPSDFSLAPAPMRTDVPVAPTGLPSELLERRPDIAAAERSMASANAQIGVAIAAYYPTITLQASYGFVSTALESLIQTSHSVWSFGPNAAETVFDGGLRSGQVAAARATYDQTVANYRQTVLAGFQQVEDELAALRVLEQQAEVQDRAVKASEEAVQLILNQYRAGTVDYTTVVTAQTTALGNEQTALTVMQNRLVASITLVEALGGGWDASLLPPADDLDRGMASGQ